MYVESYDFLLYRLPTYVDPHVCFHFFGFYGVPMYVESYDFLLYRLPTYVDPHVCFVLRSYVCKILGLYHVLMYVCRVHRFVLPRFFACTDFLCM